MLLVGSTPQVGVQAALNGCRVSIIDRDQSALDAATRAAESAGVALETIQGDIRTFADNRSFDTVVVDQVLGWRTDPRSIVEAATRRLADGGSFLVTTPIGVANPDQIESIDPSDALAWLTDTGLDPDLFAGDEWMGFVSPSGAGHPGSRVSALVHERLVLEQRRRVGLELGLHEAQREVRDLQERSAISRHATISAVEEALREKRLASEEAKSARDDLQSTRRTLEDAQRELSETRSNLAVFETALDKERASLAAIKQELRETIEERNRLRADQSRAIRDRREALGRSSSLERRIAHLERDRDRLKYRLELARWKLEATRSRKWWRVGQAIGAALRRPWRLLVLPFDLVSIGFSAYPRPPRPAPPVRRVPPPRAPVGPSVPTVDDIEAANLPDQSPRRPDLIVATVLDEFSELSFAYEFETMPLKANLWRETLESRRPDLLIVESAWNGIEKSWYGVVARNSGTTHPRLVELIEWCKDRGIPTVFWNKEDPVNYDWFNASASLFDWVFTVDAGSVDRYRQELGHDRVGVLTFGAQLALHNPTQVAGFRTRGIAFAGDYYAHKHPERKGQIDLLLPPALELGADIFARTLDREDRKWPDEYRSAIVGSLTYRQMLTAHKVYRAFINVNSVPDSETMMARRVFELAACGTAIVSTPTPAIASTLGPDVVYEVETQEAATAVFRHVNLDRESVTRRTHLGIRRVVRGHTTEDRVNDLLGTIGMSRHVTSPNPAVTLGIPTNRPEMLETIVENVARQRYERLGVIVGLHGASAKDAQRFRSELANIGLPHEVVPVDASRTLGDVLNACLERTEGSVFAKMDDDDFYGPEYVGDQVDALRYSGAEVVGKWSYYMYDESTESLYLRFPGNEYRPTALVCGGTIVMTPEAARIGFASKARGEDTDFLQRVRREGMTVYSSDRHNFIQVRRQRHAHTWTLEESDVAKTSRLVAVTSDPQRQVTI